MQKTSDLGQFIFRDDNRAKIDHSHVKVLVDSINTCNLLEMRPIIVNEFMEVIDGQHRLLAAKSLGVPIFYQVERSFNPEHVLLLNNAKQWQSQDYLNFFIKNGYLEYTKLSNFMACNDICLRIALSLLIGQTDEAMIAFRSGKFVFQSDVSSEQLAIVKESQKIIRKNNGHCAYLESTKFWKAHLIIIQNEKFKLDKWQKNLKTMVQRFCVKATKADYVNLMLNIYNWRSTDKMTITDEEIL